MESLRRRAFADSLSVAKRVDFAECSRVLGAENLLDGAESRSLSVDGDAEAVAAMGIARVWEGVRVGKGSSGSSGSSGGGRPLVKGTALPGTGVSGGTAGGGRWLGARAGHWERRGTTEAGPHTINGEEALD